MVTIITKVKQKKSIAIQFTRCYISVAGLSHGCVVQRSSSFLRNASEASSTPLVKLASFGMQRAKKLQQLQRAWLSQGSVHSVLYQGANVRRIKRKECKKAYKFAHGFLVSKFVNLLMIAGKKNAAYKIFCAAAFHFLQAANPSKSRHTSMYAAHSGYKRARKDGVKEKRKGIKEKVAAPIPKVGIQIEKRDENRFLLKLHTVIKNVQPSVEARRCKVGGGNKWVPAIVSYQRGRTLAMRWIIESARRKKSNKVPMYRSLAQEFLDAYQKTGRPRQRRDEAHKLCQGNRGFLRYRWW